MAHTTPIGQTHLTTRLYPLAVLIGLLSLLSLNAVGQVISSHHLGVTRFYYDWNNLQLVINEAFEGDTIILPGFPIDPSGTISVNKRLTWIGAGTMAAGTPVTGVTTIMDQFNTQFRIWADADGSNFHGIDFERPVRIDEQAPLPITFTRCTFNTFTLGDFNQDAADQVFIRQCVFRQGINHNSGTAPPTNIFIDNSVVDGDLNFGPEYCSVFVTNCILLGTSVASGGYNRNYGVSYTRCIFTQTGAAYTVGNEATYEDCLFASGTIAPALTFTNPPSNGGGNEPAKLFSPDVFEGLATQDAVTYNESSDFKLTAGSAALDMTGTIDAGIYDGVPGNAWKEDAIPFNPHWTSLPSSFGTTNGGLLNLVNIGGAAQQD